MHAGQQPPRMRSAGNANGHAYMESLWTFMIGRMTPLLALTHAAQCLLLCSSGAPGTSGSFGIDSTLNISQVAWQPEQGGVYIGGPSITRLPNSDELLVSANLFGPNVHYGLGDNGVNASIFHSPNGHSWTPAGTIYNHCDSTLFTFGGRVYFIGPACSGIR